MDHSVPMILKKGSIQATRNEKTANTTTQRSPRTVMDTIINHDKIQTTDVIRSEGNLDGESQNDGNAYHVNQEYTRTVENVNVMKTIVHHWHVVKNANEGMIGSDNKRIIRF